MVWTRKISPVALFVDSDPHFKPFSFVFLFLSLCKQMAYDIESLRAPDMKWLGAFPSDCEIYEVPKQCLLPLTEEGEIVKTPYRFNLCIFLFPLLSFLTGDNFHSQIRKGLKQCCLDATWSVKCHNGGRYQQTSMCFCIHISSKSTKTRLWLKRFGRLRLELETMLKRGVKFEIEALSVHSLAFLSEVYIPSKIRREISFPWALYETS